MSQTSESFTNQRRRIATEQECRMAWGFAKNGVNFRCYLCGHRFAPGDGWRWQYTGGRSFVSAEGKTFGVINFMTCDSCDGDDVLDRWVARVEEFYSDKFWALAERP